MKKKTIAALLALLTSASLFGCGDPFAEAMLKDVPAYEFSSSEAETTKLTEAENSAVSAESENAAEESESAEESSDAADAAEAASELEPGSEEELAEVLRVTRAYEDAIYDQDMEALLDCTDMDLLYYIKNNEVGSREDLIAFEEEATSLRLRLCILLSFLYRGGLRWLHRLRLSLRSQKARNFEPSLPERRIRLQRSFFLLRVGQSCRARCHIPFCNTHAPQELLELRQGGLHFPKILFLLLLRSSKIYGFLQKKVQRFRLLLRFFLLKQLKVALQTASNEALFQILRLK